MMRIICAVAAVLALASPSRPDTDAVSFARAFVAGQADQYKLKQISGTGVSFHGTLTERVADGSTRRSLVVTLGKLSSDALAPLRTWDEFVAADEAGTTLVVALSGPDLPDVPSTPVSLKFSGVYDGQVRTIMRVPQATASPTPRSAPCPGEQPSPETQASFYCAPLLTGSRATIERQ